MPDISLLPLFSQEYDVGRPVLLLHKNGTPPTDQWGYWGSGPLNLHHPGNTEGELQPNGNASYETLLLPENTGPAPIKKYLAGEAPSFDFMVFASAETLRIFSPTGSASGGQMRQRRVKEHTLIVMPEQLFLKHNDDGTEEEVPVDLVAKTKAGQPFTTEDERLYGLGSFFWKVHFERSMTPYRHAEGGKAGMPVTCHVMADFTKPDGHQLWTVGMDLAGSTISLDGEDS